MSSRHLPMTGLWMGWPGPKLASLLLLGAGALSAAGCLSGDAHGAGKEIQPPATAKNDAADKLSVWDRLRHPFGLPPTPPPPVESFTLRNDNMVVETAPKKDGPEARLAGAHELFRQGEYAKAETIYTQLAENSRNPVAVVEEARYYEAECLRLQGRYPKAADTYDRCLKDFPNGAHKEQAVQQMFNIANYWLDDTREQMREELEKREGKRWFVTPRFVSFDKTKPLLDREGRAIEKLEQVRYNDMTGPMADQALFLAGSVKFFNGDYKEADHYFTQIPERHPNSPLAPQAVEFAIISKHLSTGGSDYDGRKVAEARKLVQTAFDNYPELAGQKREFLMRQLVGITLQQAEKDYKMAEFWQRTGHPGSAYFYFEIVRRRYPGTKYAEMATAKMEELRSKVEKENGGAAPKLPTNEPPPNAPRTLPPSFNQ